MPEENVPLVRQFVQSFNRRDLAAMSQRFDPEIEWTPGGPAAVERAVYQGRDEVSDGFAATWETWDVFHLQEREVRDLGDSLVWLGRARLRGGDASHVEVDQEFAIHFLVHGGKIVRFRGFREWQEALEAAGRSCAYPVRKQCRKRRGRNQRRSRCIQRGRMGTAPLCRRSTPS